MYKNVIPENLCFVRLYRGIVLFRNDSLGYISGVTYNMQVIKKLVALSLASPSRRFQIVEFIMRHTKFTSIPE